MHQYLRTGQTHPVARAWLSLTEAPGDANVRLRRVLSRREDRGGDVVTVHTPLALEVDYSVLKGGLDLAVNVSVYNDEAILVFNSDTRVRNVSEGLYRSICHVPGNLLNAGTYSVSVAII